ncbi:aldo/keto reductase [Streptomyces diastaticus subsp. diastaticus]|uniref:Aldo/keto reductase n=1 Tax=Streptomyces diastaticus subsp. diastaticus TaxID=68040 RepID=A0ABQ1CRR3_STRDI|nr:aldo/keto reductase [Streptomyces diastaticus subsp. diastaticus]GGU43124.1 aldo/keto reductase [Streptomyces diastaticus subsp. diastaticus]
MSAPTSPARRTLARGLSVHPIGIGAWAVGGADNNLGLPMGWGTADDAASRRGLERAYELGANLIDTADVYGHGHSERIIGDFTATVPRDTVVLSSKVGYHRGTAQHAYLPSAMRRQLETSLENLRTDRLDIYFFHNADFGPEARYLETAVAQMRDFQRQGLVTAVGMRGPHRHATERVTVAKDQRGDKYARFAHLAEQIRPDYLAARFNALTPPPAADRPDVFALAASLGASVLINKPLAQGLLTGKYDPDHPPVFAPGDHRLRKAWFTPEALRIISHGLWPLRERFGDSPAALTRVALQVCLQRAENAAVLVGFTRPEQVEANLTAVGTPLTDDELAFVRATLGRLQQNLDANSEVFLDEKEAGR